MTIEQYVTFKLAVETANFSKTAALLHISAAAVGKQIKTLEEAVGAQLFYRTTRSIKLTEFGTVFYEQVCRVLEEFQNTNHLVAAYRGKIQGKLKILASSYLAEQHIVPIVPEFLRLYPDVTLHLEFGERIANLEKEDLDIAIGLMVQHIPEHYLSRRMIDDRYVLCAAPDYIKKFGKPKKPADLANHRFITHSFRPQPTVITLKNTSVHIKPVLWVNNIIAMAIFCSDGAGIALLPASIVSLPQFKRKTFIELLPDEMPPPTSVHVYFKKMQYIQPKVRAFIDFITDKLAKSLKKPMV